MDYDDQLAAMYQNPLVAGNMRAESSRDQVLSALKELTNEEEIVKSVKFDLSGVKEIVKPDGSREMVRYHDPLLNDYGINQVIASFRSSIGKNVTLSCFTRDEIITRCEIFDRNNTFELARNMVPYGIRDSSNLLKIKNILSLNFAAQLNRALNGLTLIKTLENTQIQENRIFANEEKRPGIGASIRGVFGNR